MRTTHKCNEKGLLQLSILLLLTLMLWPNQKACAQTVFLQSGVNFTTPSSGKSSQVGPIIGFRMDYNEKEHIFFSSGIAYIGGIKDDFYGSYKDYSFFTDINWYRQVNNTKLYIGAGPRIDFMQNNGNSEMQAGLKTEVGVKFQFGRFVLGVYGGFNPSFTKMSGGYKVHSVAAGANFGLVL